MGKSSKRIYNKFESWSVDDCSCEYCQHHNEKDKTCQLDVCCIEDIKQEAVRREQDAASMTATANNGGVFVPVAVLSDACGIAMSEGVMLVAGS